MKNMLWVLCLTVALAGCATPRSCQEKIDQATVALKNELAQKNERLRAFNQLNPDGSLRTKREGGLEQ